MMNSTRAEADPILGTVRLPHFTDALRQARRYPDGTVHYRRYGAWTAADGSIAETFVPLPGAEVDLPKADAEIAAAERDAAAFRWTNANAYANLTHPLVAEDVDPHETVRDGVDPSLYPDDQPRGGDPLLERDHRQFEDDLAEFRAPREPFIRGAGSPE